MTEGVPTAFHRWRITTSDLSASTAKSLLICLLLLDASKLGLLEREIEDVLQRLHQERTQNPEETLFSQTLHQESDRCIDQKEIDEEDVCPICQEELLKKMLPITYCRLSIQFVLCLGTFLIIEEMLQDLLI